MSKGGCKGDKILLPSAVHLEERLTVSHSVPALGQQAVRQKHKHKGFFVSGRCVPKQWVAFRYRPSSGRMVKQPTRGCMIGGSNPGRLFLTPPPPLKVTRPGFEPPTKNLASAALPFDRRWSESAVLPHCLKPV